MSKIKLDLSQFRHVKSDKHTTILQHNDGHQLNLVHSALGPDSQAQLKALSGIAKQAETPAQQDQLKHKGMMADGGTVPAKPIADSINSNFSSPSSVGSPQGNTIAAPTSQEQSDYNSPEKKAIRAKFGYAEGGMAQKPNVMNYQAIKKEYYEKNNLRKKKDEPENKLDYSNFRKETQAKNRRMYANGTDDVAATGAGPEDFQPAMDETAPAEDAMGQGPSASIPEALRAPASSPQAPSIPDALNPNDPNQSPMSQIDMNPDLNELKQRQFDAHKNEIKRMFPTDSDAFHDKMAIYATERDNRNMQSEQDSYAKDARIKQAESDDMAKRRAAVSGQPQPQQPMDQQQSPDSQQAPAPAAAEAQPLQPSIHPAVQHQFDVSNDLKQETHATAEDMKAGHITPQHMASMFDDSSVLKKIGTFFGLLVGGAGAGITHSPNLLLEQMNKEIDRDVAAQQKSTDNRQNLLKLNQADLANKANMNLQGANAQNTQQDVAIKARALTRMQAAVGAYSHLVEELKKTPPNSPEYQKKAAVLTMMYPLMEQNNAEIADKAAAASAMLNYGTQSGNEQGKAQQNQAMTMSGPEGARIAQTTSARHIPGVPGVAQRDIEPQDRDQIITMNTLDSKGRDLLDFIKKNKGTMSPGKRVQAEQKLEEMKNFYNGSIKGGALTQGRLDWYDKQFGDGYNPTSIIGDLLGKPKAFEEILNSNQDRKNILLRDKYGYDVPVSGRNGSNQKQGPQEGATGSYQGRPTVFRNGKWVLK